MCSNAWPSAISLEEMICFVFKPFNMPPQEINYSENFLLPFNQNSIKLKKKKRDEVTKGMSIDEETHVILQCLEKGE